MMDSKLEASFNDVKREMDKRLLLLMERPTFQSLPDEMKNRVQVLMEMSWVSGVEYEFNWQTTHPDRRPPLVMNLVMYLVGTIVGFVLGAR